MGFDRQSSAASQSCVCHGDMPRVQRKSVWVCVDFLRVQGHCQETTNEPIPM